MKRFAVAFFALALIPALASALEYTLNDDGEYTLPSGSKLGCITVESGRMNHAFCTMRLAGGDSQKEFPETVLRFGKRFTVIDAAIATKKNLPINKAWTDCTGNCISGKNTDVKHHSGPEPFHDE